jgi:uncharacterized protein (TIGR03083 family)
LDGLVSASGVDFSSSTPAAGWTIAHQIGHLTWTDELNVLACRDPEGFVAARSAIVGDLRASIEAGAAAVVGRPSSEVVDRWRAGRAAVRDALAGVPSGTRLTWLGPPMGAGTMASARILETWAHGLDVADVGFGAAWAGHRSGWARFGQNCVSRATPGSTRIVSGRFRSPVTPGSPSPEPDLGRSVPLRSAWRPRGPARALPGRRRRRV